MKKTWSILWLLHFLAVITGCHTVESFPPPPSPQVLRIGIPPSLFPDLKEQLTTCEKEIRDLAPFVELKPNQSLNLQSSDFIVQLGEGNLGEDQFAIQLGWAQLVLIAHPDNHFVSLDQDKIQELYTVPSSTIQVWTYPPNNELRQLFEEGFLAHKAVPPNAMIAPGPAEMITAILQNSSALGYVLDTWVTSQVQVIPLDTATQSALRQPILAVTQGEPDGALREYLACLQTWGP